MSYTKSSLKKKTAVALSSIFASMFLTGTKFIVGLMTGSLGLLSEAAHSALDTVAAIMTYFAVKTAHIPPDKNHTFGHGKIENLSALFETLLLLIICVWIIFEAIQRLFFKTVQVENSIWSFVIIISAIFIDIGRSRALYKAAKEYSSQALEADALHFSSDIWSSLAVLVGITFVYLAHKFNLPILSHADSIAALCVAFFVLWISYKMGKKSIEELMDSVQATTKKDIRNVVLSFSEVKELKRLRVRKVGPEIFCDVILKFDKNLSLMESHKICDKIEVCLKSKFKQIDVMIHVEPY